MSRAKPAVTVISRETIDQRVRQLGTLKCEKLCAGAADGDEVASGVLDAYNGLLLAELHSAIQADNKLAAGEFARRGRTRSGACRFLSSCTG